MFRAIKVYDGSDYPECIALAENDVISDVTRIDAHWYRGTSGRTGKFGTFPVSCVEPMPDDKLPFTEIQIAEAQQYFDTDGDIKQQRSDTMETNVRYKVEQDKDTPTNKSTITNATKHPVKKHARVERTDGEPKLILGALATSTDMLFHSNRGEHKLPKAVLGVLTGFLIGIIMFVLLKYSFDYSFLEASIIAIVCTIISSVGLAASTFCRCIMALVLPNFFTGKGRAVILSIIFGLILSTPVTNITINAKTTGSSLACITELAVNQSRAIQRHFAAPIEEIVEYIEAQKRDLNLASAQMSSLDETLKKFTGGIKNVEDKIDDIIVKECEKFLKKTCEAICDLTVNPITMSKVGCKECNNVRGECSQIKTAIEETGVMNEAQRSIESVAQVQTFFKADVEVNGRINASAETNKSLDAIQEDINRDIEGKARTFQGFIYVLKKFLSLSLAVIFFQSFWYLRNYLAKHAYDNIYITKEFRKMDKDSTNQVLPLKEKEKDVYVITSSMKLGTSELAYCKIGLALVFVHFVLCCLVVTFDFALFYILYQVSKYSDITLSTGAHSEVNVDVKGSGPVANFYRRMLKGVHIDKSFNMSLDIETCLPKPSSPSESILPVFVALYLLALAFVVLRGYGMRLRRKIAAYFYPEQERERLEYLHKKIRHKRVGLLKFLRQQIKSAHKESQVKEKLRFSTWLKFNFPCIARCLPESNALECTSCEQKESSFHHIKLTPCSGMTGGIKCDAVYCEECLATLHNVCPICTKDDVAMRE